MQYFGKTYSAIRYAAAAILLVGISVVSLTLFTPLTVEEKTGVNFSKGTFYEVKLNARFLSDVSVVRDTFVNTSDEAVPLPFSTLHFTPEIDELDKADLFLAVDTYRNVWKLGLSVLSCLPSFSVYFLDITDKIISLLETVILLN